MVYLWFLLALLLLVAALALLWLDRRQRTRRGAPDSPSALEGADGASSDADWMTTGDADPEPAQAPAPEAGSAGAPEHGTAATGADEARPGGRSKPPVRPVAAAGAAAGAGAAGLAGAAAAGASRDGDEPAAADAGAPASPAGKDAEGAGAAGSPEQPQPWTPPTGEAKTPPFAAGASSPAPAAGGDAFSGGSPSADVTARLARIGAGDTAQDATAQGQDPQPAAAVPDADAAAVDPHAEPIDDTSDYYGTVSDSEQSSSAKPGRMQRLKERLTGAKKGAFAAGAAAAGAAGAVAAKRRGKDTEDEGEADPAVIQGGAEQDQFAPPHDADHDTAAPHPEEASASPQQAPAQRTEVQQQWLASRGFAADAQGAENVYRGRFRGAETTLLFAERQLHVSLRRPGPNATEFSLERSSGPGDDGATVEQMNLRSADESTDALLTDPRVVRALRGAPAEFAGATVDAQWAHTSIPVDAVAAYDATIVSLHGIVAAAASLPARAGSPLDLSHTDPGSAAESRGGEPGLGLSSPSAPRPVGTDSDAVTLGDDRLDDSLATEVPKASAADREAADGAQDAPASDAPADREPRPEDVPLAPRRPGRPGHLRLVQPAGEQPGAEKPGAEKTAGEDGSDGDSGSGRAKATGAAAATGIAAALAGVAARKGAGTTKDAGEDAGEDAGRIEEAPAADATTADAESDPAGEQVPAGDVAALPEAGIEPESEPDVDSEAEPEKPAEPNPFDAAMRADDVPANRGDVAADFLPERPAAPRPSRGAAASFGSGAAMPSLGEPELGRHEAPSNDEFKALGASEQTPAETRESISEEMRRFENSRVGGVDAPGEADPARADAAEAAAQRAELAAVDLTPAGPVADGSADVEDRAAEQADEETSAAHEPTETESTEDRPRRGRHAGENPNALSIADLLAREAGAGNGQADGGAGGGSRERGGAASSRPDAPSADPDFVETTRFPQIEDPNDT